MLRIVSGFMFTCHGAQKLFGAFGGHIQTGDPWGLAGGIIEFVGGLLIMIGLFTGPAAFLCSGEMAVAYFKAHAKNGALPIVNHGELAVLYCFLFLYIASEGSGPYGLDRLLRRRRVLS
jgi:putative oxidoreductase